jgi:hypothetical protein
VSPSANVIAIPLRVTSVLKIPSATECHDQMHITDLSTRSATGVSHVSPTFASYTLRTTHVDDRRSRTTRLK